MITTYRVNWRNARSVYASPRTTTVTIDTDARVTEGLLAAAVAVVGHHEEPSGLTADDIHVRGFLRVIDIEHRAYPAIGAARELVQAQLAPWERLAYVPNEGGERWGGTLTRFFAALIHPSSAHCVTCDCDASDAVAPWALGITTRDGRSVTVARNVRTHLDGHLTGEQLKVDGAARDFIVYPDRIG